MRGTDRRRGELTPRPGLFDLMKRGMGADLPPGYESG